MASHSGNDVTIFKIVFASVEDSVEDSYRTVRKKLLLRSTLKFLKRATFCVSQLIVSPADAVAPSEHLPLVVIDLSFPSGFSARSHNSMRPSSIAAAKDVEFCGAQTTLAKAGCLPQWIDPNDMSGVG